MSKVFRGKFTDGLYCLDQKGEIMLKQPIDLEQKHLHPLYRRKWVVFAKRPVAGNEKAVAQLPPKRAGPNDDFKLNNDFYRVA